MRKDTGGDSKASSIVYMDVDLTNTEGSESETLEVPIGNVIGTSLLEGNASGVSLRQP